MVNGARVVQEFIELVQVDSVSGQERKMADLLKSRLGSLGLQVWEDNAGARLNTTSGNVLGRLPATAPDKEPLLLCAHMDTVEPGAGVVPVEKDGTISSSGDTILGADDKAGIVAILEALRVVREQGIPHGGIEVVFTVWEEGGLLGAKNLEFERIASKIGYVLDSDGPPGTIVVRAPSQDRISATVYGKAAHAGINPEDGINAIQVASKAISAMQLGRIDSETTANLGIISGGKAINIVPDAVSIKGEARSLVTAKRVAQTGSMVRSLEETARAYGTKADVVVETLYQDFELDQNSKVVRAAVKAAQNLGYSPNFVSTGGGSDANIFNSRGIVTANLGIAMQKVHTTEEFILVENLINNARYLVEIIKVAQVIV